MHIGIWRAEVQQGCCFWQFLSLRNSEDRSIPDIQWIYLQNKSAARFAKSEKGMFEPVVLRDEVLLAFIEIKWRR